MVYLYATMSASEVILKNNKRLNPVFDNVYLDNNIVVMDEEFYLNYGHEFNSARIVVVTKSNLSSKYDVESYNSIYSVVNCKAFYNRDLYVVGGVRLLKEVIPLATEMIFNVVDEFCEYDNNVYFPKYDFKNWKVVKAEVLNENISRFHLHRINSYGYDSFKSNKKKVKNRIRK